MEISRLNMTIAKEDIEMINSNSNNSQTAADVKKRNIDTIDPTSNEK